jgi:hypothetical protein
MKKRIPWNKGKIGVQVVSDETKAKLSIVRIGNKNAVGSVRSKKHRLSVSKAQSGKNNWNWKGGLSTNKRTGKKYIQWRSDVFTRDNWTCQTCQSRGIYLEAHHIKSWAKYPRLRYVLSNGVSLCLDCHKLTDNYKGKNNGLSEDDSVPEDQEAQEEN